MAGVMARRLRHYDAIGLLPSSGLTKADYRLYQDGCLLRVQQTFA